MTSIDQSAVAAAYEDVRSDNSSTTYCLLTYNDEAKKIECNESGDNYEDALSKIDDSTRCYIFVRVETGDEMTKVSTDKAVVKEIIRNFAYECLATETAELKYDAIKKEVIKAGGANYGTGK
eukprot:Awhi_evm1s2063